jgi:hypothetical protein
MRSSHAVAIRLFECLGLDVALTGDLLEECARGRSAIWYWRQVLIAVSIGIWGDIRDHKALALRAVATGFAMEFLFLFLWDKFSPLLPDRPVLSIDGWITNSSIILLTQAATGWVVARTHRARPVPMVLVFLIGDLLWYVHRTFAFDMVRMGWIDQPGLRLYLVWYLTNTLTLAAGVLVGGIFGARPKKLSQADSKIA